MMPLLKILADDLLRYVDSKRIFPILKIVAFSHAFHLVFAIRIGQSVRGLKFIGPFLSLLIEYLIRVLYASDISCRAKIGEGLMIVHGHDIVIGGDVVIGKGCKIFNGVTLGNKDTETKKNQQPHVGEFVVISTGAKILGCIDIGSNSIIGANSVVLNSVPPQSIAIGVPARILKRK